MPPPAHRQCGVRDRHLGLVRFGHRDYDPAIGRFTAPDPLGDTGGDHDLWECCVDDPVSRIDPQGLDDGNWLGEMFSNAWQSVKDWWDNSPQPNAKDAIVGTADAAAKMSEQAGNVASSLQKAGMTTADNRLSPGRPCHACCCAPRSIRATAFQNQPWFYYCRGA